MQATVASKSRPVIARDVVLFFTVVIEIHGRSRAETNLSLNADHERRP